MAQENSFSNLTGQQFMSLATYRKTGVAVPTPVWFVDVNGSLFVTTESTSGKVKRLRNNGNVTVAPCKANGNVTGPAVDAQARILPPEEFKSAEQALKKKYGLQWYVFGLLARLRGGKGQSVFLEIAPGD